MNERDRRRMLSPFGMLCQTTPALTRAQLQRLDVMGDPIIRPVDKRPRVVHLSLVGVSRHTGVDHVVIGSIEMVTRPFDHLPRDPAALSVLLDGEADPEWGWKFPEMQLPNYRSHARQLRELRVNCIGPEVWFCARCCRGIYIYQEYTRHTANPGRVACRTCYPGLPGTYINEADGIMMPRSAQAYFGESIAHEPHPAPPPSPILHPPIGREAIERFESLPAPAEHVLVRN